MLLGAPELPRQGPRRRQLRQPLPAHGHPLRHLSLPDHEPEHFGLKEPTWATWLSLCCPADPPTQSARCAGKDTSRSTPARPWRA